MLKPAKVLLLSLFFGAIFALATGDEQKVQYIVLMFCYNN
jgi:hypothetical protein